LLAAALDQYLAAEVLGQARRQIEALLLLTQAINIHQCLVERPRRFLRGERQIVPGTPNQFRWQGAKVACHGFIQVDVWLSTGQGEGVSGLVGAARGPVVSAPRGCQRGSGIVQTNLGGFAVRAIVDVAKELAAHIEQNMPIGVTAVTGLLQYPAADGCDVLVNPLA